jgi:hypothetical protein
MRSSTTDDNDKNPAVLDPAANIKDASINPFFHVFFRSFVRRAPGPSGRNHGPGDLYLCRHANNGGRKTAPIDDHHES